MRGLTTEEMQARIEQLEKELKELKSTSLQYYINIEKVDINEPILERLIFRLDTIDIDEVSGALNLGNNFGMKVIRDKKSSKEVEKKLKLLEQFPFKQTKNKQKKGPKEDVELLQVGDDEGDFFDDIEEDEEESLNQFEGYEKRRNRNKKRNKRETTGNEKRSRAVQKETEHKKQVDTEYIQYDEEDDFINGS